MGNLDLNTLEQKRQELLATRKKKIRLPLFTMIGSFILGIIFFAVGSQVLGAIFIFFIPFIALIWLVVVASKYKKMMKGILFDKIFEMMNLSLKYGGKEKLSEFFRKTMSLNFFGTRASSKASEDFIHGELDGLPFVMADVHVQQRVNDRSRTIFRGPIGYVTTTQNFPLVTLIPDKAEQFLGGVGKFLNKLSVRQISQKNIYFNDDPAFEKQFVVWTKDENYARQLLTPQFRNFLTAQANKFPIYMSVKNNDIFLGIDLRKDSFVIKMKKPITQNTVDALQNEFLQFFNLIKEIKDIVLSGGQLQTEATQQPEDDVPPPPTDDVPPQPDNLPPESEDTSNMPPPPPQQ